MEISAPLRRPSAPFRVRARKSPPAPKRHTRKCGHPGTFRHKPDDFHEPWTLAEAATPGERPLFCKSIAIGEVNFCLKVRPRPRRTERSAS